MSSSSSSDSQSTSLPFCALGAFVAAFLVCEPAFPLPFALLAEAEPVPSCFARFGARGLGAAGPTRSALASAASLRLPLRSGAPGWALPPSLSGVGSDCFDLA